MEAEEEDLEEEEEEVEDSEEEVLVDSEDEADREFAHKFFKRRSPVLAVGLVLSLERNDSDKSRKELGLHVCNSE